MNKILKRSRSKKNDELYTELPDIELELPIHAPSFKDKSDYPKWSEGMSEYTPAEIWLAEHDREVA